MQDGSQEVHSKAATGGDRHMHSPTNVSKHSHSPSSRQSVIRSNLYISSFLWQGCDLICKQPARQQLPAASKQASRALQHAVCVTSHNCHTLQKQAAWSECDARTNVHQSASASSLLPSTAQQQLDTPDAHATRVTHAFERILTGTSEAEHSYEALSRCRSTTAETTTSSNSSSSSNCSVDCSWQRAGCRACSGAGGLRKHDGAPGVAQPNG